MAENLDPEVITQLNREYREQYESLRSTNLLAAAQLEAEKSKIKLNDAAKIAYQGSIDSLKSFTKALTSQESSFQKYTQVAVDLSTTVANAAKEMGGMVGAMGSVLKVATQLANAMAIQADAVVKSKDQVAKFGAVGDLTTQKLLDLAHQAGYYSLNMNKLYQSAGKAGGDLLIFSRNMSEGVQTFAKMADVTDQVREEFNNLGIGQDELTDYMADYVKQLAASGIQLSASQKTQEALRKGSLEYTKNILELAALSGQDVDTVKKKQQEAQASIDFMIHQYQLQKRANELLQSNNEADRAEGQALQERIKGETAVVGLIANKMDSAATAAIRSFIAFDGQINETNSSLLKGLVNTTELNRITNSTTMTANQKAAAVLEEMAKGQARSAELYGTSIRAMAGKGGLADEVLLTAQNFRILNTGGENAIKNQVEIAETIAKPAKDRLKKLQSEKDAEERAIKKGLDEALGKANPFMVPIEDVMKYFKEQMAKASTFMKEKLMTFGNFIGDWARENGLGPVVDTVVTVFKALAVEAARLYEYFGGLSGLLQKIFSVTGVTTAVGASIGGVVGSRIPGLGAKGGFLLGAAAGGAVGEAYEGVRAYFSSPNEAGTSDKTPSMGTATRGGAFDPRRLDTGGGDYLRGNVGGLDPELQKRLMAAAQVYGKPLTITSGFRTFDKQKELYDRYKAGKSPFPAAPPGSSKHERGMAVDIGEYQDPAAVRALASQGLMQTVKGDEPHFEIAGLKTESARGSSSASGPSVQSSEPTTTAMSSSDDTLIRVMIDMRNSINSKMQEMVDKVAESNSILEKIMRHSS